MNEPVRAVNITRKEKEYQGMLEYKQGDESRLLKNLVVGMLNLFFGQVQYFFLERGHIIWLFCSVMF